MEEYEENKREYLRISFETRNKLTTLSATLMAGIYLSMDKLNSYLTYLKIALLFYVLTIMLEIISGYLKSQHYVKWFKKEIKSIDYEESTYGKWAEKTWWFPAVTFFIGSTFFFIAILKL